MDKELKQVKEQYTEHYYDDEISNRIKSKVYERILKDKRKWSLSKKITFSGSVAIIILFLLVGSAFVSPAMAKVVSKVSFINQIVQSLKETDDRNGKLDALYDEISKTLYENKEYKGKVEVGMSWLFSSEPPSFTVWVGDEDFKQEHEDEIKDIILKCAKSYKIDGVEVVVEVRDNVEPNEKNKELEKLTDELLTITQEVVKEKGYTILASGVSTNPKEVSIKVGIEGTEQDYKEVKNQIEKQVHDVIYAKKHEKYEVEVKRESEDEIKDQNWQPIFTAVMEETHKKFKVTNGFAYSFHPKPLEIILKTSLSKGEENKEQAERIEEYARQVVEIKRKELSVEAIPYKIIIRDKEHKKLYEKLYN
ncbi:DUF4179 domain-containing protein [Peribacillus simplex]|uniref:DUF4179 domain-containing protein n=1 Tax=Peribacillus simplex TaxID=1478 RepID=A0AAW7IKM4_9BACI|nr:DUF4179 domain-containing protein [Peribacillus simplex]MDM5455423.1 DUF4179 domain-containing protein [Peribacillus simplex]